MGSPPRERCRLTPPRALDHSPPRVLSTMMKYIHAKEFRDVQGRVRTLRICAGDATEPNGRGQADLLGLSCFMDNYDPTPGTIVEALDRRGIRVSESAAQKARDFREKWHTWVSNPLHGKPFGRLVCFEHQNWRVWKSGAPVVRPSSVVGNVFRAVSEFALEGNQDNMPASEFGTFRLPLLSTGNQGAEKSEMLEAIIRQAYDSLRGGLPVRNLEVVLYLEDPDLLSLVAEATAALERADRDWHTVKLSAEHAFDFFVSYRRTDAAFVQRVLQAMRLRKPDLNIFLDQENLKPGTPWKPELVRSIYNARHALCIITDTYPDSSECMDEFHVALSCSRNRRGFLRPVLRLSEKTLGSLPATVRGVNLIDGRCPPREMDEVVDALLAP